MRYLLPLCLLLATLSWGQEQPVLPDVPREYRPPITRDDDDQKALPASVSKVAPDAAVITIRGLCARVTTPSTGGASDSACATVITRAQFERLAEAIQANVKPSRKRVIASSYPNLLVMAHEAEARGLDKTSRFQERLEFARVQILSQELVRQIDEDSAQVSRQDLEDYYHNHPGLFEQATLERIFIPNRKQMTSLPKDATPEGLATQQKDSEGAMTRVAEELRSRAAAGEDFFKLQKDAYAAAGATDAPPNPNLGQLRSSSLPPAYASVFNLKPGEVSAVLSDGTGHYIYKLDAKGMAPLQSVTDEIGKTLQNQHRDEAIQAVQRPITTELNSDYFGPAETRSPKSK